MREALTLALNEYEGGVVLVSHDRHLLRTTADTLLLVADGKVTLSTATSTITPAGWLRSAKPRRRRATDVALDKGGGQRRPHCRPRTGRSGPAGVAGEAAAAGEGGRTARSQAAGWQKEKSVLDEELADPAAYTAPDRAALEAKLKRQAQLDTDIAAAEERWLRFRWN